MSRENEVKSEPVPVDANAGEVPHLKAQETPAVTTAVADAATPTQDAVATGAAPARATDAQASSDSSFRFFFQLFFQCFFRYLRARREWRVCVIGKFRDGRER